MDTYKIIRFYKNRKSKKNKEIIREGFTLEKAQEWCSRDDTKKEGVWFDGYTKE